MPELFDHFLVKSLAKDKKLLETTQIPAITVSAAYREDLKRVHGYPDDDTIPDVVFSRAHYSMAAGIAVQVWGNKVDPSKMWVVDPTNYVSHKQWHSILLTENIGKILARNPLLKSLKDIIDKFARQKLPILKSITPPLLHLTENISYPILSLHIAAGNILIGQGKRVVQVITDPHVRNEYVFYAEKKNVRFCVFDEQTKTEFLEKAAIMGKDVDPEKIIVTGPPVDPRIIACRNKKLPWRSGCLNLCLTTGGLGTNSQEMMEVVSQLIPRLRQQNCKFKLLVYTGTHDDIYQAIKKIAKENRVKVGAKEDLSAQLRIIYHPQLVDANEALTKYAFPWADGFITKPSGDMAYDAVASGSFILTLDEWGEWEERIREVFEQKEISRVALTENISAQLKVLTSAEGKAQSWVEKAMNNAQKIDPLFLNGSKEIIKAVKNFK
jgi:hypothetical protein